MTSGEWRALTIGKWSTGMTKDEWQAQVVERTLCNDWQSPVERDLFISAYCERCGHIAASVDHVTKKINSLASYRSVETYKCACGDVRLTRIGREFVKPCPQCGEDASYKTEQIGHFQSTYTRVSCKCGYMKARI